MTRILPVDDRELSLGSLEGSPGSSLRQTGEEAWSGASAEAVFSQLLAQNERLQRENHALREEIRQREQLKIKTQLELVRASRAQRMLSQCTEVLVHAQEEQSLLQDVCRISVDVGEYLLAWVGLVQQDDPSALHPVAFAGLSDRYETGLSGSWNWESFDGVQPASECLRTGQIVFSENMAEDERFAPFGRFTREFGIHSSVCIPLVNGGRVVGVFVQYASELYELGQEEIMVLKELAENLAYGIVQLRERERQRRLESLLLRVAAGVSATSGVALFEQLGLNMADVLGAQGAFVFVLHPKDRNRAKTIAAVVRGAIVENFECEIEGTPCEVLTGAPDHVVTDQLMEIYPAFQIGGLKPRACVGRRLDDSAGDAIGMLILLFEERLQESEFAVSAIRIFAARAGAELERETNDSRMREQASILERANDAIILRTLDQRVIYWNRGAENLYGWSYEEVVGKPIAEVLYVYPPALDEVHATVMAQGEWRGQLAHRRKDGGLVTVESHWTLLRDKNGDPESISTVSTDITQRLLLEERLRHSQKMDSIGQLTGGVAHDFNNILTVIIGATDLLLDQIEGNDKAITLLGMANQAATRGAELTHQMLAFSRRQALQPKVLSVGLLLDDMVRLICGTIGEHCTVKLVKSRDLGAALIDPAQLQSALLNLCLNSRDAMPNGGSIVIEASNVTLDASHVVVNPGLAAGDYISIAITDTGIGIPLDHMPLVFDPFFTTKDVGKGTGLGLSMVYGFVKQSQGYIKIYSEPGCGTSVKLYLPRVSESDCMEVTAEPVVATIQGTETVLAVEDDPLVLELAVGQLQALGYTVISASNGSEALRVLQRNPSIDLLFTDVVLPGGMNGRQLADEARVLRPELKVLYASGYTENAIMHQDRLDPDVHLINKPYRSKDLAHKVRTALSERCDCDQ
jgi:PAS domain S-box-containing protein